MFVIYVYILIVFVFYNLVGLYFYMFFEFFNVLIILFLLYVRIFFISICFLIRWLVYSVMFDIVCLNNILIFVKVLI